MDKPKAIYQQPNELQGLELKIWESSEFQVYLVNQLGPDNYGLALHTMTTDMMIYYIGQFQNQQLEELARLEKEREQFQLKTPGITDVDPLPYVNNGIFQSDVQLVTSNSTEGLMEAYMRLRGFADKLQQLAPTMSIEQAQFFSETLQKLVPKQQLVKIGTNPNFKDPIKATTPSKFNLAQRSLEARLKGPKEISVEKPWVSQLPTADEAMQAAKGKFFSIAEHGLLTGKDRKRLGVGSTQSVDAKETISSVIASEELNVNIILSTRQARADLILLEQEEDEAKGWLHIALEDPNITILDLYNKGASANELKAVCQHRVMNTVVCVMTLNSLTSNNAMIGEGPSRLKSLIADRESPYNPRAKAQNQDRVHECIIPSSILPIGFVAILVPEALMGFAAVVAKHFAHVGLNVSFYPVPTTSYQKRRGQVSWSFSGPNYNAILATLCDLPQFEGQPLIFHIARLR